MKFKRRRMLWSIGKPKMWWNSNEEKRLLWKHIWISKYGGIPMRKRDFCGNTIKSANVMKSKWEKRLFVETQLNHRMLWNSPMWKRDYYGNIIKSVNVTKFQCGKETFYGNAIKSSNVMKFLFDGTRQIFNSVEYSEVIVEFLF